MGDRITPGQSLERWKIGMTREEVKATFEGKPRSNGEGWQYGDFNFRFDAAGLYSIDARGSYTGTYKGVGVGSTMADVLAAFGSPYRDPEHDRILVDSEPLLFFALPPAKMTTLFEVGVSHLEDFDHVKGLGLKALVVKRIGVMRERERERD